MIEFSRKILVITTTYDKIYSNNIEEKYEIVVNRVIVFIGWSLSTLFLVVALAGLATPGAGKLMSLAMIGWCSIFLPPFWKKTIQYGLPTNIISRVVAFITLPVLFMAMATANGYKPEVSTVKTQPEASSISVSPTPVKTEPPNPLSERVTPKPAKSSIAVSPTSIKAESPKPSISSINQVRRVTLTAKATPVGTNDLVVSGETDLPEGFLLSIQTIRWHFEKEDMQKHYLSLENISTPPQLVEVKNGKFSAKFTVITVEELRSALKSYYDSSDQPELGKSTIDNYISVNIFGDPRKQPAEIKKIIGENGEKIQRDPIEKWATVYLETRAEM
jgi:hypothetical protein